MSSASACFARNKPTPNVNHGMPMCRGQKQQTRSEIRRLREERFPRLFVNGKKVGRILARTDRVKDATFATAELTKMGFNVITTSYFCKEASGVKNVTLHSVVLLNFEHPLSELEYAKYTARGLMLFASRVVNR